MKELLKNLWNKKLFRVVTIVVGIPVTIFMAIVVWAFCEAIYDVVLTDNYEEYKKTPEYKLEQQKEAEEEKAKAEKKAAEEKAKAEAEKKAEEEKAKKAEAEKKAAEEKAKAEAEKKAAEEEKEAKAKKAEEEKMRAQVNEIARKITISYMEDKGLDCLTLQDVSDCMAMFEADMIDEAEVLPNIPEMQMRLFAANAILELAQLEGEDAVLNAIDIIEMRDFMKANDLIFVEHYAMMANGMTRQQVVEIALEEYDQLVREIQVNLFGYQAGNYEFTIWNFDINTRSIKLTVEARDTGRELYTIMTNVETGEYHVMEAQETFGDKLNDFFN